MTNSIQTQSTNLLQLLNTNSFFSRKATTKPETSEKTELFEEKNSVPVETEKLFANHNIDEIRQCAKEIGENNLSDEDIKYGLFYGQSVIADYSV